MLVNIDLAPDAPFPVIQQLLTEQGIVRIQKFLPDVESLKIDALNALETHGKPYKFGKVAIIKDSFAHKSIKEVFDTEWMRTIAANYLGSEIRYVYESYITHDFINDQGTAPNGFLHFDRHRTFKFLIYLKDTNRDCGALSCFPGSHKRGKQFRETSWAKAQSVQHVKNRIEVDYPKEPYTKEDAVPMTGPAGTLLIFDTDIFHFGGMVESGNVRLLIRTHTRVYEKSEDRRKVTQ